MEPKEFMLQDLRKSGLSDETISEMKVIPCPAGKEGAEMLKDRLGYASLAGQGILQASDCYFFEYPDGYSRAKLGIPLPSADGKPAKYLSPKGNEGKHSYYLERDKEKLQKAHVVWITEGEKKTALLSQELRPFDGHVAIGFPGVWMWPKDWKGTAGRTFVICYDSDFLEKREVQLSIAGLAFQILASKGVPKMASWNPAEGKGIDDYLFQKQDRAAELENIERNSAENPFSLLNLVSLEDAARQAAKTNAAKQVIESWFERYGFRKIYSVTKGGFSALVKSARNESIVDGIRQKAGGTLPSWIEFDEKGKPFLVPGPCALEFYERQGGNLVYAQESFFRWTGKAWEPLHDSQIKAEIQEMACAASVRASKKLAIEDVVFQARNWALRPNLDFDADKNRIALQNGVLDLDAMKLAAHCREHYQTILLPYAYQPDADCPRFRSFLAEIFPANLYADSASVVDRLQEWAGYCLVPTAKLEKCLYLLGEGSNGKGVFLKTLAAMIGGQNVSALEPKSLFDRFQLIGLRGKLVNICTDIDTKTVFSEEFKKIVSGEPCTVDVKFKDHAKFSPFARHLFSANGLIATKDRSYGFFRRFDVIEFRQKFAEAEKDEGLLDSLEKELPGIFNWALDGLRRLRERRWKFSPSPDFDRTKERFEMESNPVAMFVSECCENLAESIEETGIPYQDWPKYVAERSASTKRVRERYVQFCVANGHKPLNDVHLGKELARLGYAVASRRLASGQREQYYRNLAIS